MMMKKMLLCLVIGILIGAVGTAMASTQTVQAIVEKMTLIVNEKERTLEKAPIMHEGALYVPASEISDLLGYDFTYREKDQTLVFDVRPGGYTAKDWISLDELKKQYGLSVKQMPGSGDLRYSRDHEVWFDLPAKIPERGTPVVSSLKGQVRIIQHKGVTIVNLEDLQSAGLTGKLQ